MSGPPSLITPSVDVVVVGGGPAGLSAALMLARATRKVVVCDNGKPRNRWATEMHGYLTRDRIKPADFLHHAHTELRAYPTTEHIGAEVVRISPREQGFDVLLEPQREISGRKVLLATGVNDELPDIPGFVQLYGRRIHHCPYCDGWEIRGTRLGVLGEGEKVHHLALKLTGWSRDLVVLTNGENKLSPSLKAELRTAGIEIFTSRVHSMHEQGEGLELALDGGTSISLRALFFTNRVQQTSRLAEQLGCELDSSGGIATDKLERTSIPGIFAAGNMIKEVEFVVVAAAEGAKAALGINHDLILEDLKMRGLDGVEL